VEVPEQLEALLAGELGPEAHVAGHVGEVAMAGLDISRVDSHHGRRPRGGADEPEQETKGRGLARAVRPEESEHLALFDVEREVVERDKRTESLRQIERADRRLTHMPEARSLRWRDG
jgi:hypothetical protein